MHLENAVQEKTLKHYRFVSDFADNSRLPEMEAKPRWSWSYDALIPLCIFYTMMSGTPE